MSETVSVREAQILFAHFLIVKEAARCDDRGLRVHSDLVAILIRGNDTRHRTIFVLDELLAPGIQKERLTSFFIFLLEEIDPTSAAAFIDMPRIEPVRVI